MATVKKLLVVFGTRPEAIKLAPLILALRAQPEFECRVCVTGQHREMVDSVLDFFGITAEFDLEVMKPGQGLDAIVGAILRGLTHVFAAYRPDMVIVHGDTATTLASTLAAYFERIPVSHVEAGLRTGDLLAPWPEEGNRKLTAVLSALHFAPTDQARENLIREGFQPEFIYVTGNTVIDALFMTLQQLENPVHAVALNKRFKYLDPTKRLILVTGHRRENLGAGLDGVCDALLHLAQQRDDIQIVYPVHPNPGVREPVTRLLGGIADIVLEKPLEYFEFVYLISKAYLILTDSGGIQEEAPSLGKPVLVLRETTERPEAVRAGTVRLVGTDSGKIVLAVESLLDDDEQYRTMSRAHNPYGDGKACGRIVKVLCRYFSVGCMQETKDYVI